MENPQHSSAKKKTGQFALLGTQRFAPFFWTQFLGAFNDNVFKNALIILIAYQSSRQISIDSNILTNLAAGLFILPFFLFSAAAGQISDKYPKDMLIRRIKLMEIVIMSGAAAAFYFNSLALLFFILFLMGAQSAFFGPVKYSIIPQHLKREEVVGGNALVSMGTFVAILLGTLTGGLLVQKGNFLIGLTVCIIALAGWLTSCRVPTAPSDSPDLKLDLNPFTQIGETLGYARRVHSVFLSVLGISWFWFLGSAYLTQIPNFTKLVLRGNENVVTLLLTTFSIGIGAGSLLCERLSGRKVELGLVPLGSLGLSIFGIDLFLAYTPPPVETLMGVSGFMATDGSIRVLADLILIGIFGGFYIVPLNAFIQMRTESSIRSRVIAANNILNALFMVASALTAMILLGKMKLSIPAFFLVIALTNIVVAAYIYSVVPEFAMRFLIWILSHTMYRVRHKDLEKIPDEGPVLLVSNHVSYVDGLLIGGAYRRPVRFVVFESIYNMPILHFIFKTGKAIPIHSQHKKPEVYKRAFEQIHEALAEGEVVCIFPEGKLTTDGEVDVFKPGVARMLAADPVPVVPIALRGLWGSFFSHRDGTAMTRLPSRFWSRVEIVAGDPLSPEGLTADILREKVRDLRGEFR